MNIGQSKIPAAVAERQTFVIDTHQMQDGGMEVVDVYLPVDGVPAEVIGRAMNVPPPFTPPPAMQSV